MMCCNACGGAAQADEAPGLEASSGKRFVWRDKKEEQTLISLRVPSLVERNGDVFAVTEAYCKGKDEKDEDFHGIASEPLKWTDGQSKVVLDKNKLKTQLLEECSLDKEKCASPNAAEEAGSVENKRVDVRRPTTVVNGSDIYMLAAIYMRESAASEQFPVRAQWGLLLSRGNVSDEERDRNKRIYWNYIDALQSTSNIEGRESFTELTGGGGSGV
ncbi:trans-sialidase, putative, partial [Trypanosoma cruzi marinkellei]